MAFRCGRYSGTGTPLPASQHSKMEGGFAAINDHDEQVAVELWQLLQRNIEELDGDEEVDTLSSRSSRATSGTHPASFFVSLSTNTLYCGFILFSVAASLLESPGSSRFSAVSTSSGDDGSDPIGGAVAGCGIGGRDVERFSLLAPACPSGALAVVPAFRKPGVGAATHLSPDKRRDWFG